LIAANVRWGDLVGGRSCPLGRTRVSAAADTGVRWGGLDAFAAARECSLCDPQSWSKFLRPAKIVRFSTGSPRVVRENGGMYNLLTLQDRIYIEVYRHQMATPRKLTTVNAIAEAIGQPKDIDLVEVLLENGVSQGLLERQDRSPPSWYTVEKAGLFYLDPILRVLPDRGLGQRPPVSSPDDR
jgi:hypothetical protein